MAKKGYKKMTPEERRSQQENQQRLEKLLERRLEREGITKEDALSRLRPGP